MTKAETILDPVWTSEEANSTACNNGVLPYKQEVGCSKHPPPTKPSTPLHNPKSLIRRNIGVEMAAKARRAMQAQPAPKWARITQSAHDFGPDRGPGWRPTLTPWISEIVLSDRRFRATLFPRQIPPACERGGVP